MDERVAELFAGEIEDLVASLYLAMVGMARPRLADLVEQGFTEEDVVLGAGVLCSRGLVEEIDRDRWEVRPPESALARYAEAMEQRARESRSSAGSLGALWRQATRRHGVDPGEGLQMLTSGAEIVRHTQSLVEQTRERLWWVMDPSAASRELLQAAMSGAGRTAAREGVQVSLVVDRVLLDVPGVLQELEDRCGRGCDVRLISRLPFTALVSDDTAALVDLSAHDPAGDGSFEVRRANPVTAVRAWCKVLFDVASPLTPALTTALPTGVGVLDERDHHIMSLLATGLSDQVIARSCGISTRTVERRVRHLMDRLGATTRFQAGAQAVRRGWL